VTSPLFRLRGGILALLSCSLLASAGAQNAGTGAAPAVDERACTAMNDVNATIISAQQCARSHGWQVSPYWTQISEWYSASEKSWAMRIMCATPTYTEAEGRRQVLFATRTLYRAVPQYGPLVNKTAYSFATPRSRLDVDAFNATATVFFETLDAAGNAACGTMHLPDPPKTRG
jgi:hypothetical protein